MHTHRVAISYSLHEWCDTITIYNQPIMTRTTKTGTSSAHTAQQAYKYSQHYNHYSTVATECLPSASDELTLSQLAAALATARLSELNL